MYRNTERKAAMTTTKQSLADILDGSAKSCDLYASAVKGDRVAIRRAYLTAELAAFAA